MELVQLISTGNEKPRKNSKHIYLGNWCLNNSYIIKNKTGKMYCLNNAGIKLPP